MGAGGAGRGEWRGENLLLLVSSSALSEGARQRVAGVSEGSISSGFTPRALNAVEPRSCEDSEGCFAALPGYWTVWSPTCFCGCCPEKVPLRGFLLGASPECGTRDARGGLAAAGLGEMLLLGTSLGFAASACSLWDEAGTEGALSGWQFLFLFLRYN